MTSASPGAVRPAEPGVLGAFTRGLAIFRPIALLYAAILAWVHREDMNRPIAAVAVFVILLIWSVIASWRRTVTTRMAVIDLTLATLGILATSLAFPREAVVSGALTLPGIWSSSGVVAAAIRGGARGGLIGAAVISVADLVSVVKPNFGTIHNIVLLILLGWLIGLSTTLARESQRLLEVSVRAEESYTERERLARIVHDGVLQTLTFINRRGNEIGGPAKDLATLAADQERSLRDLVSGRPRVVDAADTTDLAVVLRGLADERVTISAPAEAVMLPKDRAGELRAAVVAALDNVRAHAGPDARAWVLVEDLGGEVVVTVRDNGVGMPPGRPDAAAAEGRLGMASSIRGRMRDLGGDATWTTARGRGCTVVLTAPKDLEPLAPRRPGRHTPAAGTTPAARSMRES